MNFIKIKNLHHAKDNVKRIRQVSDWRKITKDPSVKGLWSEICKCCVNCSVGSDFLWPPQTVAPQASLSMGFSKQEYLSRLPLPFPEDLPDLGIELGSPAVKADSFPFELQGSP